jgi:hypothetical protein
MPKRKGLASGGKKLLLLSPSRQPFAGIQYVQKPGAGMRHVHSKA